MIFLNVITFVLIYRAEMCIYQFQHIFLDVAGPAAQILTSAMYIISKCRSTMILFRGLTRFVFFCFSCYAACVVASRPFQRLDTTVSFHRLIAD